jgi:hypothetical protein
MISFLLLKRHVRIKHDVFKLNKQDYCNRKFTQLRSLYKHINKFHKHPTNNQEEPLSVREGIKVSHSNSDISDKELDVLDDNFLNVDSDNIYNNINNDIGYILKLYVMPNLSRSDICTIIENARNLL